MSNENEYKVLVSPELGAEAIRRGIEAAPTPIQKVKALRVLQQALNDAAKDLAADPAMKPAIAEIILARRAGQQVRHWAGEALSQLGEAYPYPTGADPTTDKIDPRADVAKGGCE